MAVGPVSKSPLQAVPRRPNAEARSAKAESGRTRETASPPAASSAGQTGATDEVAQIVKRMRELAVQASSESLTSSERTYVDSDYQALGDEIESGCQKADQLGFGEE